MNFFVAFIAVNDYQGIKPILLDFKHKMNKRGEFFVFDTCQVNYDFLYNSMMEKANDEKKKGLHL
jgi:hypothetical protein